MIMKPGWRIFERVIRGARVFEVSCALPKASDSEPLALCLTLQDLSQSNKESISYGRRDDVVKEGSLSEVRSISIKLPLDFFAIRPRGLT